MCAGKERGRASYEVGKGKEKKKKNGKRGREEERKREREKERKRGREKERKREIEKERKREREKKKGERRREKTYDVPSGNWNKEHNRPACRPCFFTSLKAKGTICCRSACEPRSDMIAKSSEE